VLINEYMACRAEIDSESGNQASRIVVERIFVLTAVSCREEDWNNSPFTTLESAVPKMPGISPTPALSSYCNWYRMQSYVCPGEVIKK